MSRRKFSVAATGEPNSSINITPLVDVVLVMLIIFMAVTPPDNVPVLSTELVDFCVALIFSTICTISVSPTIRARWSSNRGR